MTDTEQSNSQRGLQALRRVEQIKELVKSSMVDLEALQQREGVTADRPLADALTELDRATMKLYDVMNELAAFVGYEFAAEFDRGRSSTGPATGAVSGPLPPATPARGLNRNAEFWRMGRQS